MPPARLRLGQLLVDAQIITAEQLSDILVLQKTDGRRLGTLLTEAGLVNETQLTQILSQQLNAPWVSLYHIDFSRQLLNLVPREVVERFCLVPIYVRHVRGQGATLYVAMDDPSNDEGLKACTESSGLPARAMIAPPSDIRNAIRVYYGGRGSQPSIPAIAPGTTGSEPIIMNAPAVPSDLGEPDEPPTVESAHDEAELSPDPDPPTQAPPESVAVTFPVPRQASVIPSRPSPSKSFVPPPPPPPASRVQTLSGMPPAHPGEAAAHVEAPTDPSIVPPERAPEYSVPLFDLEEAPTAPADAKVKAGPGEEPEITVDREHVPEGRRRQGPRMVALTLLDGTTITLPAKKKRPSAPTLAAAATSPEEESPESEGELLTARDLIAALRAVTRGADATDILGPNKGWEAMFAALLSLLLRKHLIADWEFIEEYRKI